MSRIKFNPNKEELIKINSKIKRRLYPTLSANNRLGDYTNYNEIKVKGIWAVPYKVLSDSTWYSSGLPEKIKKSIENLPKEVKENPLILTKIKTYSIRDLMRDLPVFMEKGLLDKFEMPEDSELPEILRKEPDLLITEQKSIEKMKDSPYVFEFDGTIYALNKEEATLVLGLDTKRDYESHKISAMLKAATKDIPFTNAYVLGENIEGAGILKFPVQDYRISNKDHERLGLNHKKNKRVLNELVNQFENNSNQ